MHVQVSHINAGEVGDSAEFEIQDPHPDIPDLKLAQPISGRVQIIKLDDGLQLTGQASLAFNLECYRCLDPYEHQTKLNLSGLFKANPGEDDWLIDGRGEIDLTPLVRQEALVSIPIQQLCRQDCEGLCATCGQRQTNGHRHSAPELKHLPRIKPLHKVGE